MIQSSILGTTVPSLSNVPSTSVNAVNTGASSSIGTAQISADCLFDMSIDDAELLEVVERASQNTGGMIRNRQYDNMIEDEHSITENGNGSSSANTSTTPSAVATQSISNNSTLNAMLSRSFKSVTFEKNEGCTFNFYLGNQ